MKVIIIRQSAVIPSDFNKPKDWREIYFFKWSRKIYSDTELWISNFDHYALKKRREIDLPYANHITQIKTIGYKKTVSIWRVVDAWIFGIKIFFRAMKKIGNKDVVVVSLPTPESVFFISMAKILKGFRLIVDVRDNWPDNFTGKGYLQSFFKIYVLLLNKFSFKIIDKVIWMSEGLYSNHKRKKLLNKKTLAHVTIPVTFFKGNSSKDEQDLNNNLFSKPVLSFFGTLNEQFDLTILKNHIQSTSFSDSFNFLIIGDGNQLDFLRNVFKKNKNVHFLGQKPYSVTQIIARKSAGFFLFYREPRTYSNHITNKLREYSELRKPIFHNLDSNIFTIMKKEYHIGNNLAEISFEKALKEIKDQNNTKIFNIKDLEALCNDLSIESLEKNFIEAIKI